MSVRITVLACVVKLSKMKDERCVQVLVRRRTPR